MLFWISIVMCVSASVAHYVMACLFEAHIVVFSEIIAMAVASVFNMAVGLTQTQNLFAFTLHTCAFALTVHLFMKTGRRVKPDPTGCTVVIADESPTAKTATTATNESNESRASEHGKPSTVTWNH